MTESANLAPVDGAERLQALDVLRGFALLGILLMNIEGMAGPLMASMTGLDPALSGADRWVDGAIYLLVQGKFFPLFSLLFGMGFAVMMMRAEASGRPFFWLYLRRVLVLLAIGLAHALLLWPGDILVSYALMGLVLLLGFRRTPVPRLPKWGVAMMLAPALLMMAFGLLGSAMKAMPGEARAGYEQALAEQSAAIAAQVEAQRQAYGHGSFAEATAQRLADLGDMLGFLVIYGWLLLGLFLVGAWFARSGAIADPGRHAALFARLRRVALPVGAGMVLASFLLEPTMDFGRMDLRSSTAQCLQMLGGAVMALAYLAWVLRALDTGAGARWLGWLAPAGRMALSNYLLQSLVMTSLFHGYGLGWYDQLPRAWQPLLVFAFFMAQVLLSHAWLARFRFGPMEWLWRAATYGRLPPMRR